MKRFHTVFIIALPVNAVLNFCSVYIFSDWEFVRYLVVAMVLDTALGFIIHWRNRDLSSKAYGMIAKKLITYSAALILANVVTNFKVYGQPVDALTWFGHFVCVMLMVRETLSIIENIEDICPGFFPKSIITRLKDFDSITGGKLPKNNKDE